MAGQPQGLKDILPHFSQLSTPVDRKNNCIFRDCVMLCPMPDEVFSSTGLGVTSRVDYTGFRVVCKVVEVKNSEVGIIYEMLIDDFLDSILWHTTHTRVGDDNRSRLRFIELLNAAHEVP